MAALVKRRLRDVGRGTGLERLPSMRDTEREEVARGVAAGLVGGLIASWVMERFQALLGKLTSRRSPRPDEPAAPRRQSPADKPATVVLAGEVAHAVLHRDLTERQEQVAGRFVHYAYGAALGGLYGGLAEGVPEVTAGAGAAYGAVTWLVGDEVLVPALGLSKPSTEYPLSTHAYALASHLVYGFTLEGVRRGVRAVL